MGDSSLFMTLYESCGAEDCPTIDQNRRISVICAIFYEDSETQSKRHRGMNAALLLLQTQITPRPIDIFRGPCLGILHQQEQPVCAALIQPNPLIDFTECYIQASFYSLKPNTSACPNPTMMVFKQFFRRLFNWQSMIILLLYHLKYHRRIHIQH